MDRASLFLDSGAFSALMCNKPLDIEDYIAYVKDHLDVWDIYANLDDISCPEKTWVNQRKMEAAGLTPLPVYHATEDLKYLRMAMEYDYFAVGGMAGGNKASLQYQVDGIFSIICPESNDFYPLNKVHGFGITKPAFVVSYPWFCMTDEHTILTKDGWKSREEIRVGDMVLTNSCGDSEWKPVLKVHQFDVIDAPVRKYKGRFTASTTMDHKWLTNRKDDWFWERTKDFDTRTRIPRTAEYTEFPETNDVSDLLIKLIAWVWTDGCITNTERRKKKGYKKASVSISQKHPHYVEEIRNLLINSNVKWSEYTLYDMYYFDIMGDMRDGILSVLTDEKKLPFDFILSLTKDQLTMFMAEVLKGDGYKEYRVGGDIFNLMQKRTRNLDAFIMGCVLLGIPINSQKCNNVYQNVLSSNTTHYTPSTGKYEDVLHTGKIWCIEVENHTFYTRCGGSYYWTGNSVDSSSWVRYGLFGMVLIPKISFGNYLYNVPPMPIVMSNRSKSIGEGQHFANTSAIEQAAITKYFADKGLAVGESVIIDVDAGYELKEDEVFINKSKTKIERILVRGLVNDHTIRDQANLMYYLDLEKNQQAWPWQWLNKSGRLF